MEQPLSISRLLHGAKDEKEALFTTTCVHVAQRYLQVVINAAENRRIQHLHEKYRKQISIVKVNRQF